MDTGKLVDDGELREAMKSKGIGRPSTRSAIIEVLFKRGYIERKGKTLLPTTLGCDLIHTIQNEQIKSVQLTGEWSTSYGSLIVESTAQHNSSASLRKW